MHRLGPHLQQIDRTYVLHRGRRLSYFGGCDYFRLSQHPAVMEAMRKGAREFGLNVSASRLTTGNHRLYETLERELAEFFGVQSAILVSCGYAANLVATEIFARNASHMLIDEKAHASVQDAARYFNGPIIRFRHQDSDHVDRLVRKLGPASAPLLLTDGMFSQNGSIPPLKRFLSVLPARGMILVDDAHAAGVLGKNGCGSIEHCEMPRTRFVQCITLSKAFGVYGGAVLGRANLARDAAIRSRWFSGNTPMPLPLASAALESLRIFRSDQSLRQRLVWNVDYVKSKLRGRGFPVADTPSPIISFAPETQSQATRLKRRLLSREVYPSLIKYPGGPPLGNFRFALSSEHSRRQLDLLITALSSD